MEETQPSVPFSLCRPGTRLEFQVYRGSSTIKPTQGVVKALSVYGAHNFLVLLSEYVDENGVVHTDPDPLTKSDRCINLSHATRVLEHGQGDLVFESSQPGTQMLREDLVKYRANGTIQRRGRRLVVDGNVAYAPGVVRFLVMDYLATHLRSLGVLPWEMLDGERVVQDLADAGICCYAYNAPTRALCEPFPVAAELDTERMKCFLKRNINRYKLDLRAEEKARDEEDERYYREEMERDFRSDSRFGSADGFDEAEDAEFADGAQDLRDDLFVD